MTNRTDLDLDVVSFVKELHAKSKAQDKPIDESVFYLRKKGDTVFITYFGDDLSLSNCFVTAIENNEGMLDIMECAVSCFYEDQPEES